MRKILAANVIILWKYSRLIGNQRRLSEQQGQIFDRKLINDRFCACTVNICLKVS